MLLPQLEACFDQNPLSTEIGIPETYGIHPGVFPPNGGGSYSFPHLSRPRDAWKIEGQTFALWARRAGFRQSSGPASYATGQQGPPPWV